MTEPHEAAVDVHEMARILGLSVATIYTHVKTGKIPGFKVGNSWRFFPSEVLAHLRKPNPDPWAQSYRSRSRRRRNANGGWDYPNR